MPPATASSPPPIQNRMPWRSTTSQPFGPAADTGRRTPVHSQDASRRLLRSSRLSRPQTRRRTSAPVAASFYSAAPEPAQGSDAQSRLLAPPVAREWERERTLQIGSTS